MTDHNKHNLLYFESDTMRGLFQVMDNWQKNNGKRLLSANVQKDKDLFCCIALTNPMEVIIACGKGDSTAYVTNGKLWTV